MALSSAQNWHGLAFFSCHAGSNGGFVKWVALIGTCSPAIIDFHYGWQNFEGASYTLVRLVLWQIQCMEHYIRHVLWPKHWLIEADILLILLHCYSISTRNICMLVLLFLLVLLLFVFSCFLFALLLLFLYCFVCYCLFCIAIVLFLIVVCSVFVSVLLFCCICCVVCVIIVCFTNFVYFIVVCVNNVVCYYCLLLLFVIVVVCVSCVVSVFLHTIKRVTSSIEWVSRQENGVPICTYNSCSCYSL